jgi:hypothetical protein
MVSWYHHCLFFNERENATLVKEVRRDLPFVEYEDVRLNLPAFIEYAFTRQRRPGFSWSQFVLQWFGQPEATLVRYEDVRRDPAGELNRIIQERAGRTLDRWRAQEIVDEFSFERQAGRAIGQENKNSFMRKGIVGDWRNHFTNEAREVFFHYAGDALVRLGYEQDDSWVKEPGGASDPRSPEDGTG